MTPHSELFAEDFHAYSVAENYPEKELTVDLEGFYKGYDEGKFLVVNVFYFYEELHGVEM